MATPISYNLARIARHIKSEYCNMLFVGDSINTQETDERRPCGVAYGWRPDSWRGWTWPTGGQINDSTGTGAPYSAGDVVGQVGPAFNEQFWATGAVTCNRYDLAGRTWQLARQTATYDVTGAACGTPQFSASPGVFPVAYREQQWTGTIPGVSTIVHKYTFRNTSLAKFWGGDPFASKTTTARLIGYKSTASPPMQLVAYRGSGSAATAMNFNGAAGYFNAEAVFPTTANATLQLLLYTHASTAITSAKPLTTVGVQIRNANTTGLMTAFWANSGWNTETFVDTALVSDANLAAWLSQILGTGLGTATPSATNGPTAIRFSIGENQTATETTELNAGTYTTYKSNLRAAIARTVAACNSLGTQPLLWIEAPYQTLKSATNNAAMSAACYELAQELGCAFTDLYQLVPPVAARITGRISTGVLIDSRLNSDSIHPGFSASVAMEASCAWAPLEMSLVTPARRPRLR